MDQGVFARGDIYVYVYEKKMRAFALSKNSVSANLILDRLLLFNKRGNT